MAELSPFLRELRAERTAAWSAVEVACREYLAEPCTSTARSLRLALDRADLVRRSFKLLREAPR